MHIVILASLVCYAVAAPSSDFFAGCYFDGRVYQAGETIMISHCLATMQCLGHNNYGQMKSLGGICPDKREADGQTGCLYDGTVYAAGDTIMIKPCLAEMSCLGYNSYSTPVALNGECPDKREVDGQTGCLFDGRVYAPGDKIVIQPCEAEMTCKGHNSYSYPVALNGQC